MDKAARIKRFDSLVQDLTESYALLRELLALLPIPMHIMADQADDPILAIHALACAAELANHEPVSGPFLGHLRSMITEWLTAYELAVNAHRNGPAPWRLDGIEAALNRFAASADYVASRLVWHQKGRP
ncbi:MAG: hypothetical protein ACRDPY_26780 [Streptosporangiaceae bacterium]